MKTRTLMTSESQQSSAQLFFLAAERPLEAFVKEGHGSNTGEPIAHTLRSTRDHSDLHAPKQQRRRPSSETARAVYLQSWDLDWY